jgi:hypothetical protein
MSFRALCSLFVLMIERKKHLANVAFGGRWSEELVERDRLARFMAALDATASDCFDQDVYTRELIDALDYVQANVEKGPMLVAGFQKALLEPIPSLRQTEVQRYVGMIRNWAGM